MKKCVPRTSDRIITVLAAGILCSGISIHTIWKMIYMGNWGFFYNDEKIIFVLSHKDSREFRWDELQNGEANIFYPSSPAAWYFYFHDEKKIKKIAVTPRMAGYYEFFGEDFGKEGRNKDR